MPRGHHSSQAGERKTCLYCRQSFVASQANQLYCSDSHRAMACQVRRRAAAITSAVEAVREALERGLPSGRG